MSHGLIWLKILLFSEKGKLLCVVDENVTTGGEKAPNDKTPNPKQQKTKPATKVVFDSRNVVEGIVFMSHLKNIKAVRCLEITCPCGMEMLMIHEAESHLNVKSFWIHIIVLPFLVLCSLPNFW